MLLAFLLSSVYDGTAQGLNLFGAEANRDVFNAEADSKAEPSLEARRNWASIISTLERIDPEVFIDRNTRDLIFIKGNREDRRNYRSGWIASRESGGLNEDNRGFYRLPPYAGPPRGAIGYFTDPIEFDKRLVCFLPVPKGENRLLAIRTSVREIDVANSTSKRLAFHDSDAPKIELWNNMLRLNKISARATWKERLGINYPIPNQRRWAYAHFGRRPGLLDNEKARHDFIAYHEGGKARIGSNSVEVIDSWHGKSNLPSFIESLQDYRYRYYYTKPLIQQLIRFDSTSSSSFFDRLVWVHENPDKAFLLPIEMNRPDFRNALVDVFIVIASNGVDANSSSLEKYKPYYQRIKFRFKIE